MKLDILISDLRSLMLKYGNLECYVRDIDGDWVEPNVYTETGDQVDGPRVAIDVTEF